jgi:hypothetical protein
MMALLDEEQSSQSRAAVMPWLHPLQSELRKVAPCQERRLAWQETKPSQAPLGGLRRMPQGWREAACLPVRKGALAGSDASTAKPGCSSSGMTTDSSWNLGVDRPIATADSGLVRLMALRLRLQGS